jgi:16S rRNA (guanine1207-N2)-methyltransferase
MSVNNINQLLLRNTELLAATSPLLVNIPVDNFYPEYQQLFPAAKLHSYHSNFQQFQIANNLSLKNTKHTFSAQYQTKAKHDLVIIQFPKSKAELTFTIAMLAEVVTENATLLIVGENKSGIKSLEKLTVNQLSHCQKVDAARHCLLFVASFQESLPTFVLDDWLIDYQYSINEIEINVRALPGVFSQKSLDIGSKVLLENLPTKIRGKILDFGCGAGVIACFIGKQYKEVELELLDVSALAIYSAEKTLEKNELQGKVFASDSLSAVNTKYDHVISNPPFHQGIKTNYQATETFLENIKQKMAAKGKITIVANSFLKYQPIMEQSIGRTKSLCKQSGFTIYHCAL